MKHPNWLKVAPNWSKLCVNHAWTVYGPPQATSHEPAHGSCLSTPPRACLYACFCLHASVPSKHAWTTRNGLVGCMKCGPWDCAMHRASLCMLYLEHACILGCVLMHLQAEASCYPNNLHLDSMFAFHVTLKARE